MRKSHLWIAATLVLISTPAANNFAHLKIAPQPAFAQSPVSNEIQGPSDESSSLETGGTRGKVCKTIYDKCMAGCGTPNDWGYTFCSWGCMGDYEDCMGMQASDVQGSDDTSMSTMTFP